MKIWNIEMKIMSDIKIGDFVYWHCDDDDKDDSVYRVVRMDDYATLLECVIESEFMRELRGRGGLRDPIMVFPNAVIKLRKPFSEEIKLFLMTQ